MGTSILRACGHIKYSSKNTEDYINNCIKIYNNKKNENNKSFHVEIKPFPIRDLEKKIQLLFGKK